MRPVTRSVTRSVASTTRASGSGGGPVKRALQSTGTDVLSNTSADGLTIQPDTSFTLGCWAKLNGGSAQYFFGKAGTFNFTLSLTGGLRGGGRLLNPTLQTLGAVDNDYHVNSAWHHYAVVVTNTATNTYDYTWYVDYTTLTRSLSGQSWARTATNGTMYAMGAGPTTILDAGHQLYDIRMWIDYALTPAEVEAWKDTGANPAGNLPDAWWPLNDADPSSTVLDVSGNGYHFTNDGAATQYVNDNIPYSLPPAA